MMGFIIGVTCGLFIRVFANGLARQPLMHNPWNHGVALIIGGVAGMKWDSLVKEKALEKKLRSETFGELSTIE